MGYESSWRFSPIFVIYTQSWGNDSNLKTCTDLHPGKLTIASNAWQNKHLYLVFLSLSICQWLLPPPKTSRDHFGSGQGLYLVYKQFFYCQLGDYTKPTHLLKKRCNKLCNSPFPGALCEHRWKTQIRGFNGWCLRWETPPWNGTSTARFTATSQMLPWFPWMEYGQLAPTWPLCFKSQPLKRNKEGLFQSQQGSFGFQVHLHLAVNVRYM